MDGLGEVARTISTQLRLEVPSVARQGNEPQASSRFPVHEVHLAIVSFVFWWLDRSKLRRVVVVRDERVSESK